VVTSSFESTGEYISPRDASGIARNRMKLPIEVLALPKGIVDASNHSVNDRFSRFAAPDFVVVRSSN